MLNLLSDVYGKFFQSHQNDILENTVTPRLVCPLIDRHQPKFLKAYSLSSDLVVGRDMFYLCFTLNGWNIWSSNIQSKTIQ